MTAGRISELDRERAYVARLYERLDELRDETRAQLAEVHGRGGKGTYQDVYQRDVFATEHEIRLAQLNAVDSGLCFGRLDMAADFEEADAEQTGGDDTGGDSVVPAENGAAGQRHYIGRIGLSDHAHDTLLVDWRAPVAQPFYRATPAAPLGVVRRRHLHTRLRAVTGVDDEVFDLAELAEADPETLSGEAALLAALSAGRTGRMGDIVATIQAEQDRIIRSDLAGVLVVQGGPGTGKTAVALHRAAYLLYTHRNRLSRAGVLVVGPNPVFLRYIGQVLPTLGETGVRLTTAAGMLPDLTADRTESTRTASLKGDPRMAELIRAAVRTQQRVPREPMVLAVDHKELELTRKAFTAARQKARRSGRPHNQARAVFSRSLQNTLVEQAIAAGSDPSDADGLRQDIVENEEFERLLDALWPRMGAQRLIRRLYADPKLLAAAADQMNGPRLTPAERGLLVRPEIAREKGRRGPAEWTPADVPLLDEAEELMGDPYAEQRAAAQRQQREAERRYAEGVLEMTDLLAEVDPEFLADRHRDSGPYRTLAERAEQDREWAYGHVIVDEAQELSPMDWRMIGRRCPSKSMTVVGDIAQTSAAAGAGSWAAALEPVVGERWRREELTVNYRTPSEVMDVAAEVLASADPDAKPPRSVRDAGLRPWARRVGADDVPAELGAAVTAEVRRLGDTVDGGTVAVLAAVSDVDSVAAAVGEAVEAAAPGTTVGRGPQGLDAPVAVLSVAEAKGLEFDSVLIAEPAHIADESPRGQQDLYIAVTRTTTRLGVVHAEALPLGLERLAAG